MVTILHQDNNSTPSIWATPGPIALYMLPRSSRLRTRDGPFAAPEVLQIPCRTSCASTHLLTNAMSDGQTDIHKDKVRPCVARLCMTLCCSARWVDISQHGKATVPRIVLIKRIEYWEKQRIVIVLGIDNWNVLVPLYTFVASRNG